MLARHFTQSKPVAAADARLPENGEPGAAGSSALPPVFDRAVLAALPMVVDGSQPRFVTEVLELFVQNSTETVDIYERATAANDVKNQLRSAHTLKSQSAQVGALALASIAQELEELSRVGGASGMACVSRLRSMHNDTLRAIAVYLGAAAS
jgi:HPt (histidine-containing phosphotransfer) domain-containing protein